jgi:ribonucleoside-diphosphate reductase alpha chain
MQVIKRNGQKIDFNPNKILLRIKKQSDGLKVNPDDVFLKVTQGIGEDMTTNQVDDLISVVAESLSMNHPDYSKLAANISISKLHKETEDSFMKAIKKQFNSGLLNQNYFNKAKENIDLIESVIDYKRDFNFDYFGWCSLKDIYLLKAGDTIVERPQQMYVRVALMTTNNDEDFIEKYNDLSQQMESPATPIKINIGTRIGQIASCNLSIVPDDSTEGLLSMLNRISISSSKAEGIGLAVSNIRSKESNVGKSDGKAGGILKYLKVVNEALRFWNQRGKRPGSCAIYIEPWHKDIFDILDIRKKTGDETLRARDLFSALWISDNFMRAVENNSDWYLFCPNDIKQAGLKPFYEIYGEEFENEYNKAVEMGLGVKIKAHDLWLKILEAQIETGMPYMCFKDAANIKSNQKNIGPIHSSNLCSEIMEHTDAETTAICTLTSIPVQKFVKDGAYDFNELGRVTRSITKSLNIAIDVNEYSTEEGKKGGLSQRALGIGIQGLADTFAMLKLSFTSEYSRMLNKNIFETIYFNALTESCRLAKETGLTYDYYEGSPISKGIFQWEMWGIKESELSGMYDWSQLRKDIKKYGVRNSLVTTCPPTASSARVIGSNEAFEPFTANLYVRKVTGGEFAMVNKHLVKELEEAGLWNREILNELIKNDGSVQNIPTINEDMKERYKTVWEISQKSLIEMSADRGPFIDQSQSLNIFFATPTVGKLTTSHTLSWKLGLKTGQYYLRSQSVDNKAKHLAIDMDKPAEVDNKKDVMSVEEFKAMVERAKNSSIEDCDMCSS